MLCVTGTFNTVVCVWAIGEPSGVGMFYFACILIGVLLFRGSEWIAMVLCTGLPIAAFWFLRHTGVPLHVFSAQEYASLVTLHAVSVGSLIAFVGYKFSTEQKP